MQPDSIKTPVNRIKITAKGGFPPGAMLVLMGMPFFILLFIFSYLPLYGWLYAFYDYKPGFALTTDIFVGLKHFLSLISDSFTISEIIRVMRNTIVINLLGILAAPIPMIFAVFLVEIHTKWYRKVVQTFTAIPNFISWVLMFSVVYSMFSLEDGFVNKMLVALNIVENPVNFMASDKHVWLTMILYAMYKGLGWSAIIYIASLSSINPELYDAAAVDGAGRFKVMWHITTPGLANTFFVLLLLTIANLVNVGMEQFYIFQNAMNKEYIEVLDLYIYNTGIGGGNYSYATAIGMIKTVVSLILLFSANKASKIIRGESII